jgi:hypothetical protein
MLAGPVNTITGMPLKPDQAPPVTVANQAPTTASVAVGEAAVGAEVQYGKSEQNKGIFYKTHT